MKVVGIIPARLASTRFPNKPLAKILGHSMIEHVYRRAETAKYIDELYIATCDDEIAKKTREFGGKTIMTSSSHTRGTDRVAEAARKVKADIILNIQGDEPLVDPEALDGGIMEIKNKSDIQCVNLVTPINNWKFFIDHNIIKATLDKNNRILYFSRLPIPSSTKEDFKAAFKQIGIYIFRKEFLLQFSNWKETSLEMAEKIDMLRILEHGFPIGAFYTKDMVSVDTPEDLFFVEEILSKDPLYQRIFKKVKIHKHENNNP